MNFDQIERLLTDAVKAQVSGLGLAGVRVEKEAPTRTSCGIIEIQMRGLTILWVSYPSTVERDLRRLDWLFEIERWLAIEAGYGIDTNRLGMRFFERT